MNFHGVTSAAQVEMLAPPPRLVTDEERQRHRHRWLAIAMTVWHENFLQDVYGENKFFTQQQVERNTAKTANRARKAFILAQMEGPTTIDDNDPRWGISFRPPSPVHRAPASNG
ncbi:uncharacterized protein [Lolium perenne]|uniref:uncharacterized protein n=1 Tax=Lolium perenne TaxID=4522 RepID=UPI0021F51713|nr:uncharacterized protein LOC127329188 [Lolium perenne]